MGPRGWNTIWIINGGANLLNAFLPMTTINWQRDRPLGAAIRGHCPDRYRPKCRTVSLNLHCGENPFKSYLRPGCETEHSSIHLLDKSHYWTLICLQLEGRVEVKIYEVSLESKQFVMCKMYGEANPHKYLVALSKISCRWLDNNPIIIGNIWFICYRMAVSKMF